MTFRTRAVFTVFMLIGIAIGVSNLHNESPRPTVIAWALAMVCAIVATAPRRSQRWR